MKNLLKYIIVLLLIIPAFPHPGSSQDNSTGELRFEVNRIYPPVSVTKEKLHEALTLNDMNPYYQSSWVKEYISVVVSASDKGRIRNVNGKNDILSQEQKDLMNKADRGTDIEVKVQYMPQNTLSQNDAKEINFTFTVEPESEASYPGGPQQLDQYIQKHAIDKISETGFRPTDFSAVKFTVNEDGHITDAHVFWKSENAKAEELLLMAISNMPRWKPAEYAGGVKVKQEFVLTVGNMENCAINLLNIRRN
jgi:hypothetical protein